MMKAILGIIAIIAVVAIALFVLKGCRGDGDGPGTPAGATGMPVMEQHTPEPTFPPMPQNTPASTSGNEEENKNSNVISVRIEEDRVYVNGEEIPDAEALEHLIEEINDDEKIFELTENEKTSILATHNWVHDVFDELEITPILLPVVE